MANIRQYIGARYVIKIYENSVDPSSAEWEQGNFEPLTMVTWMNGSYLSKKEVPANIGNPADNPSYWVQTGFYNGQIASLQSQINDINSNIGDLSILATTDKTSIVAAINEIVNTDVRRKYVFVGDSYGETYDVGGVTYVGWFAKIASVMGLNAGEYIGSCVSGWGFRGGNYAWNTYLNTLSYDEDVTDVVFIGGDNDIQYSSDPTLKTAIETTLATAKSKFPKARIWVGFCAVDFTFSAANMLQKTLGIYSECATLNGAIFMNGLPYCLYNRDWVRYPSHPNNDGTDMLAGAISSALNGGTFHLAIPDSKVIYDDTDAVVQTDYCSEMYFKVDDNILTLHGRDNNNGRFSVRAATALNYTCDGGTSFTIAKATNLPIGENGAVVLGTSAGFVQYTTGGWKPCVATWLYYRGYIQLRLFGTDASGYYNYDGSDTMIQFITMWPSFIVDLLRNGTEPKD